MAAISASVNLAVFILPYVVTYVLAEGQAGKLVSYSTFLNYQSVFRASPSVMAFCYLPPFSLNIAVKNVSLE